MHIGVEGDGGIRMAEVFTESFDIDTDFDTSGGEGMTKGMKIDLIQGCPAEHLMKLIFEGSGTHKMIAVI